MFSAKFALLSALASIASAATVTTDLTIANGNASPDGFTRRSVLANNQYPGPLVKAKKGDTLVFNVNNQLTDQSMRTATSLNMDGIWHTTDTNYEDGTPFVTQCPIARQTSYSYEVPLINDQTGTHWYHSQLGVQYLDGFRGSLIIYDDDDPHKDLYDVDNDSTIIQLGDWWHNSSVPLFTQFQQTGIIPVADSATFNGKGRFNGGPATPFSVVNVVSGLRYRLRILNQSVRGVFTASVDSHNLTVIEADGSEIQPLEVHAIDMLAGQRYSAVLHANQPIGNYWFNAPYVGGSAARNPNFNISFSRGIVRYLGALPIDPPGGLTLGPQVGDFKEVDMVPLVADVPKPGEAADVTLTFELAVVAGEAKWQVSGISYVSPAQATLQRVLSGQGNTTANFARDENTFIIPEGAVVDVVFPPSDDDDEHPIHMHGAPLWVLKSSSDPGSTPNLTNPPRRDTVGAGQSGMTLRIQPPNGAWFLHCHIYWHMAAGLASVMNVGPNEVLANLQPPSDWQALCPNYNSLGLGDK